MNQLKRAMSLGALAVLAACSSMPEVTRTGMVKDVMILDEISPTLVSVQTGDEVRWINRRQAPVKIIFLQPVEDRISCSHGFGGVMASDNTTLLDPNESASLCFSKPGTMKYTVRGESALPVGEINLPGTIRVQERTG